VFRIDKNTVNRTNVHALRGFIMAHAFGAKIRRNFINFFALGDGAVGALGFTYVAIDAFVSNI
jgi:hypothetical protein